MLKLLDYGRPNPFGETIGRQRNLAWPVSAYRVTLPRISEDGDGLNPFERVILKLLDALGVMDARALADETRIPLDLVKSILLRLQDKGLIDEFNAIIEQECDSSRSEFEKAPVFVTAILFRELVTGKIFPFLHWLDDNNPLRKKAGEDNFFYSVRWDDAHKKNTPTQRDVIMTLLAMKKRSAAFGSDNKMPSVRQIIIADSPELYCLDCPIAFQKSESDGEFRIADPFGNGFSLILERAFEQLLEQDEKLADWLQQWKHLLRNPRIQNLDAKPKEPFESNANWQRYPKLVASLRLPYSASFHSIARIYASIEWALFYACCHRPFESAIARLKFTAQAEHPALLADAAKDVGLTPLQSGFRPIREGKLLGFQNEKAELETLLSIAILQAQSNESHPLRSISSKYPELINRLFIVKKKRDEKTHGKGRADAQDRELPDAPFMREIVHALLPDIVFSEMPNELDGNSFADSLLDARASIQSEFTFKTFNRLGTNLQERLIHAERFFLSCKDGDDALAFVLDLYAALQSAFEMSLVGKLPPDADDAQLIKLAGMRATVASLCNELPESLRTVKVSAVRETLQGNGQSLGACVLAFLLMSDDDTLCSISDSHPSFISDVAGIIIRRGHGNEPLPLPKGDIVRLRKSTYPTIKTLLET